MSIVICITLILGIGAGMLLGNVSYITDQASGILLLLLLFSVGIEMGQNRTALKQVRQLGFKILLIPFGVAVGSLLGGALLSLLIQKPIKECLAIASGLGWYSLSGVMMTEAGNPTGGTISFLANILREVLTFLIVPLLAKYLNFYCAIAPAGATAMDTTLAVITRNTNAKIGMISFITGVTLTMLVPFLVPLFL